MIAFFLMHRAIYIIIIAMSLVTVHSIQAANPAFHNGNLDSTRDHSISLKYTQSPAFGLTESQSKQHSISGSRAELSYRNSRGSKIGYKITAFNVQKFYTLEDSINLYSLQHADPIGINFVGHYAHNRNLLSVAITTTQNAGLHDFNLQYFYTHKYFDINVGLVDNEHSLETNIVTSETSYPGQIASHQSSWNLGTGFKFNRSSSEFRYSRTVESDHPKSSTDNILVDSEPFHVERHLLFGYDLGVQTKLQMTYTDLIDTVNTDISISNENIGKIYALDRHEESYGANITHQSHSLGLTYHKHVGRLSAHLLASYFGDLLTQLSGARYYHVVEYDLTWINFNYSTSKRVGKQTLISLSNSIFAGSGEWYSRHHVFLFPNPLSDLEIQNIEINQFLLNTVELQLARKLSDRINLKLEAEYMFPLIIEVETHPQIDLNKQKLTQLPRMMIQLIVSI